jgi:hypothetical protein
MRRIGYSNPEEGGESFSDLILRKFGRGNPAAVLTCLSENSPNLDLADSVEMAIGELRRGLKLERVEA